MDATTRATRKDWADEEYGFILDNWDKPMAYLSNELGRSIQSVVKMRRKIRDGYKGKVLLPWTAEEDAILFEKKHFTAKDLTALLPGRHLSAIHARRAKIGASVGNGGPAKDPFMPGHRTLIAKTCRDCGLLLPASWYWSRGGPYKISYCKKCSHSRNMGYRESEPDDTKKERRRRAVIRVAAYAKKAQDITLPFAEKRGQEYTEADHKVLSDPSLSNLAKALRLKRTYIAICTAVPSHGYKSSIAMGDPLKDQWVIENPNVDRIDEIQAMLAQAEPDATHKQNEAQWDWEDAA
jgi:hypothetical protein